ncbi:MAG: FHA domain protein [Betaproteobacteria bacterium ADurb.Bin341]|nr:MAG: FHA domain protein [Betaproteobacteria bacterium ADurb.Bin341]
MEKRYYVEIIGRNDAVIARHPMGELPCRIGRGSDMDLILDDPHVAPAHLLLRESAEGGVEVVDLGSQNGTFRIIPGKKAERIGNAAPVNADVNWRIGQTTLHVRSSTDPVEPETLLTKDGWSRRPLMACFMFALYFFYLCCEDWLVHWENPKGITQSIVIDIALLYAWVVCWSLATRLITGTVFLHAAHAVTAGLMFLIGFCVKPLFSLFSFAFGLPELPIVAVIVNGLVIAAGLYVHLRLATRLKKPMRLAFASLIACVLVLTNNIDELTREDKPESKRYNTELMPPALLIVPGATLGELIEDARQLKKRVDEARKTEGKE